MASWANFVQLVKVPGPGIPVTNSRLGGDQFSRPVGQDMPGKPGTSLTDEMLIVPGSNFGDTLGAPGSKA